MKRNEKYSRPGKLWSKTLPYNNSIVSLFFYRGLLETSDHDITVETSIEQINVGRRNNFHLVIISNGEASRIERVFIGENFYPRKHGIQLSNIQRSFDPWKWRRFANIWPLSSPFVKDHRRSNRFPRRIDLSSSSPDATTFGILFFKKNRDKEYRNVTSLSIKLNLPFLDLVPFLSNSRAFPRLHVEAWKDRG